MPEKLSVSCGLPVISLYPIQADTLSIIFGLPIHFCCRNTIYRITYPSVVKHPCMPSIMISILPEPHNPAAYQDSEISARLRLLLLARMLSQFQYILGTKFVQTSVASDRFRYQPDKGLVVTSIATYSLFCYKLQRPGQSSEPYTRRS